MMSEKEIGLSVKNEERAGRSLKTMEAIKNKLYAGGHLTKEEAMELTEVPLDELCAAADDVRAHFCGNVFDVCTTHTYDEKVAAIRAAQQAGLTVCSGGITIEQDMRMLAELGYEVVLRDD